MTECLSKQFPKMELCKGEWEITYRAHDNQLYPLNPLRLGLYHNPAMLNEFAKTDADIVKVRRVR